MMLLWLILIPLIAGPLAWAAGRDPRWPRWIAFVAMGLDLILTLVLFVQSDAARANPSDRWLASWHVPWVPRFGIGIHLGMDGLSLLLILLTCVLGLAAITASLTEIRERVGFFHCNLLWVLAGVIGVFVSLDLFLFFVCWEIMLVPMYLLISLWGHERRTYAAFKFFLFTQAGGLLMLIAIIALSIAHYRQTGTMTFDYVPLLDTSLAPRTEFWLMLGFFAAFAVKLPAVPLHPWLPDAHTEAPTGGSVIMAGLLLKTGAYGLLRFAVPLFPQAAHEFAPVAMSLGVIGILYGAVLAFAQSDFKRLIAYSSIAHLGFVLLGIFAWNQQALQGAVMAMVAHGLSTGALFIVAGSLQERLHTRDMRRMGGLWSVTPKLARITLVFAMASLGLPGLANFVGEFLVLLGTYRASMPLAVLATIGIVGAALYSLILIQRTFHGPNTEKWQVPDLSRISMATLGVMMLLNVWLGVYPQPVLNTARPALIGIQRIASDHTQTSLDERPLPDTNSTLGAQE
jgi:NADH-quinone oxidoreductase subunit M